ncbi:hypothetical protein AC579_857 [Pseudocercospora musae]|uniref:Uncharacterized protein n=1 Tax=Pseudocercospora musae TaxID=113226 RepID=A0A139HI26_9PEZI|nr:hypothetical protein AC579_857 [Pseudocercospora musae]
MAWERYLSVRTISLVSVAVLGGAFAGVQYRRTQDEKRNANTYHVKPERSGGGV